MLRSVLRAPAHIGPDSFFGLPRGVATAGISGQWSWYALGESKKRPSPRENGVFGRPMHTNTHTISDRVLAATLNHRQQTRRLSPSR